MNRTLESCHSPEPTEAILVIGVGNTDRGDDGVGLLVGREVARLGLAGVDVVESQGDVSQLLELFQRYRTVFVIDAICSGNPGGTILCFEANAVPLPQNFSSGSTHALGLAVAIDLAQTLKQLPPRLMVFGVVGQDFAVGSRQSAAVEKAIPEVVARISKEIQSFGKTQTDRTR
ncbi:MAG: hydrogenase maturation protease [Acidobacteriia bacterium]|nr:hydrogenase maturation protease [Terriglobia bacterium]